MLILPLAPDLRVGYKPIVSFIVFFLCIGIHFLHERSQTRTYEAAENYCSHLSDPWIDSTTDKLIEAGLDDCVETLRLIHELDRREFVEDLLREARWDEASQESESDYTSELQQQLEYYDDFAASAPSSLKAAMVYYIGWDLVTLLSDGNAGGTNLLAHVVGGVTGYYLGRWWLSDRKWLIEVELQDEIEHMRASRGDWLGITGFRIDSRAFKRIKSAEQLSDHVRAFDDVLREVYKLNETHQHGDAILLLLDGIARHGESEDELGNTFETVLTWTPSRFTLCFARYYINYLLDHHKAKEALNVCDKCFGLASEFVLARPLDVMPLAKNADKQERHALVHALVHNCEHRYADTIDPTDAGLLEARMLAYHLDRPGEANDILQRLLKTDDGPRRSEISAIATSIVPLLER